MTHHSLPTGAMVFTPDGPGVVGAVRDEERVLGVRDGEQAWGDVTSVVQEAQPASAARLLTPGGEVLVGSETRVGTPRGLLPAGELRDGDRVELLEPPGLPQFQSPDRQLRMLEGMTFALPIDNGCADAVEPELRRLLSKAGAESMQQRAGRWLAIGIDRFGKTPDWSWGDQADLLSLLCAWEAGAGMLIEMRTKAVPGSVLSRSLLGALMGAHRRFLVRWTPAFLPAELRTSLSPEPWQVYMPINPDPAPSPRRV